MPRLLPAASQRPRPPHGPFSPAAAQGPTVVAAKGPVVTGCPLKAAAAPGLAALPPQEPPPSATAPAPWRLLTGGPLAAGYLQTAPTRGNRPPVRVPTATTPPRVARCSRHLDPLRPVPRCYRRARSSRRRRTPTATAGRRPRDQPSRRPGLPPWPPPERPRRAAVARRQRRCRLQRSPSRRPPELRAPGGAAPRQRIPRPAPGPPPPARGSAARSPAAPARDPPASISGRGATAGRTEGAAAARRRTAPGQP